MSRILLVLPACGFDPTEAAIPWRLLSARGHAVSFATPDGKPASADPIMVTGVGLGVLKYVLRADLNGRAAYRDMLGNEAFQQPLTYAAAVTDEFDALVLPGGHAKPMRGYLESKLVQQLAVDCLDKAKIVGAICHGVLILARARAPDGKPLLHGRKVTSLTNRLETMAYNLTRWWMGDYYRTYPGTTTEDEVRSSLRSDADFDSGPDGTKRDSAHSLETGFVVRDGNLITARWPGDAHRFSDGIDEMLRASLEPPASLARVRSQLDARLS